jgi:hypothetical protein
MDNLEKRQREMRERKLSRKQKKTTGRRFHSCYQA